MNRHLISRVQCRSESLAVILLASILVCLWTPALAQFATEPGSPTDLYWRDLDFMLDGLSSLEKSLNYVSPHVEDEEILGILKDMYDFTDAARKDIERHGEGRLSAETSHTLEQSAKYLLGKMPELVEALQKTGKVSPRFNLPATFGAEDFAVAIGRHAGSGTADVETITCYLDGLNKALWGIVGCMIGGPEAARLYQSLAGTTAKLLREASLPLFERGVLAWRRQGEKLAADWRTLQVKRLDLGLPALRISEVYGRELLRANGMSDDDIARFDAMADASNNRMTAMRRDLSVDRVRDFTTTGTLDVGGVSIDPQLVQVGEGGDELRQQTLEARPSDENVSWPVNVPD
jgi:hypothetical protein